MMRSATLDWLCVLVTDGTHDSPKLQTTGVPFIKGKHISQGFVDFATCDFITEADHQEACRRVKPQAGDILFSNIGSVGDTAWVPVSREFSIKNVALFRPNPTKVDPRYFYYLVASPAFRDSLLNLRSGSAQPFISLATLRSYATAYHVDRTEQCRIASILSAFDDLIENNTRRIAILEEMARRIYEEWFVHFRFPGHERVRMVESELGPVPEGWAIKAFDEVATFTNGYAFKPDDWTNEGVPIIKIKELKAGIQADTPRYAGSLAEKYKIENGDLLFSWSADLDVYVWAGGEGWLNQHLFLVRSNVAEVSKFFLFHALRSAMPRFRSRSNGATMRHIKRSALSEVCTIIPSSEIIRAFERMVAPQERLRMNLALANTNLRTTRDLLLPKLISGELDVSALPEAVAA